MADKLVLNTPRFKGEYDLDLEGQPLTNLEWRWVKRISGYLPLTITDGWRGGDPDLFVALAVVALHRAGKIHAEDALSVAQAFDDVAFDGGAITFVGETVEADPQMAAAETPPPNTGPSGRPTLASSDGTRPPTGVPVSPRSVTLDRATSLS